MLSICAAIVVTAGSHIGSEGRALVANGPGEVEQAAEHRLADRHLKGPAGGMGNHAATQSRRRLQGNGPNRRLIQMRLHLCDDRGALVRRDDQSLVDRRQRRAVKGDVQHRPAHGGHPAINRSCLFHHVFPTTLDPEILSTTRADQPGVRLMGPVTTLAP
jgi:hypothetical protein